MHVIDRQDAFTLVGSDARRGKLTLFAAEGPREKGAFKHVALRVSDLNRARVDLPDGVEVELGEGVRVRLVEAPTDVEYDLDHVALYSVDPEHTAQEYTSSASTPRSRRATAIHVWRLVGPTSSSIRATPGMPASRC